MIQEILYWGESEDGITLEKTISTWMENGNKIICVIPTEYFGKPFSKITKAIIIYTEPDFGKGR